MEDSLKKLLDCNLFVEKEIQGVIDEMSSGELKIDPSDIAKINTFDFAGEAIDPFDPAYLDQDNCSDEKKLRDAIIRVGQLFDKIDLEECKEL